MAVSDDPIQSNLMKIGSLEFQHLMDAILVDPIRCLAHFLGGAFSSTEACFDQLFAILIEQVERVKVGTGRYLDQLSEPISDLGDGERAQEGEIEKGVYRSVICPQTVLVVAIVDGNLDRDRGVDETNDRGRHADKVGVPAICRTGKPETNLVSAGSSAVLKTRIDGRVP